MIEFILQSRIKYFVLFVLAFILLIFILHSRQKISEDEEIRNYHEEIAIRSRISNLQKQKGQNFNGNQHQHNSPNDFNVQFYSGKQMANEIDSEKQLFQVHTVVIENVGNVDVELQCKDVFSKFGGKLTPGNKYTFQVTDLFHKRHYWCEAIFDSEMPSSIKTNPKFKNRHRPIDLVETPKKSFMFKAYGEGAPRENNHISLKIDGAFINGENMVFSKDN